MTTLMKMMMMRLVGTMIAPKMMIKWMAMMKYQVVTMATMMKYQLMMMETMGTMMKYQLMMGTRTMMKDQLMMGTGTMMKYQLMMILKTITLVLMILMMGLLLAQFHSVCLIRIISDTLLQFQRWLLSRFQHHPLLLSLALTTHVVQLPLPHLLPLLVQPLFLLPILPLYLYLLLLLNRRLFRYLIQLQGRARFQLRYQL